MAKQTINLGTPNGKDGDIIRDAFNKVNQNFTEIYNGDALNLSAVAQNIVPAADNTYDLGSPTHQWRSLYVTGNTVYFNNIPLSVSDDGTLFINGEIAATPGGSATWDSVTNKPTFSTVATSGSYDDLTDKPTIPSITGLATETYVNDAIAAIPATDLTGLATEQYVNDAVGAIVVPDVSNFITAEDIPAIPADIADLTDNTNLLQGTDFDQSLNTTDSPTFLGLTVDNVEVSNFDTGVTYLSNVLTDGADSVGSQMAFGRNTFAIQQFQDPEGDNNRLFSVFSLSGGEAILSAAQETVDIENNPTTTFGRVTADIGRVIVETSNPIPTVTPGQTITADDNQNNDPSNIIAVWIEGSGGTDYPEIVAVQPGWTVTGPGLDNDIITNVETITYAPGMSVYLITTTTVSTKASYTYTFTEPDIITAVENTWEFSTEGDLIFPDGSRQATAYTGPVQPYLEITNTPFITQPAVLGEPVTVTAAPAGSGATFDVVIGAGPVIESITVNNPGTGYVVGQNYNILYYAIGGTTTADNILIEVGSVGEAGEILTLAAYIGAGGNTPGTYTAVGELDYVPSVFDAIDVDLTLTRDNQGALFNSALEQVYDNNTHLSPLGTEWNSDGWGNLLELGRRSYTTLRLALNNAVGNNIVGAELVMHDTANDKYYKFDFSAWGQSNAGGFAYTRTEVTDPNYFRKPHNADNDAVDIIEDDSTLQIGITRTDSTGIYNPFTEEGFSNATSPLGTTWNADGWDDLSDLTTRTYTNFDAAANGYNNVLGKKFVMYVASTQKYYAIEFLEWDTTGNNNFAYVRKEIDLTKVNEGVRFADGTLLKSAEGIGRVKLESPGGRRIEEVHGYNQVSVTERLTTNYQGVSSRNITTNYEIWVTRTPELDAVFQPIFDNGGAEISISFDNVTYRSAFLSSIEPTEYRFYYNNFNEFVPQTQGNPVFIQTITGGDPAVWWNKADLPGGSANFRGAVIDYHAYSGEGTIIGTIHIVDDSGEGHISHTEVISGSTDSENDDLWLVQNEGTLSYRRIDGESKTLKVQWTAKVFYGTEFWD